MAGLQPIGTGQSKLRCPVGYHGDNRLGYCVQNCKHGQTQYKGDCVQSCPTGMALNDQKMCIRPTFNRSFFISEKTIENTTVVAVGRNVNTGGGMLSVGYFNKAEKDFVFTNPTILNQDATLVQQQALVTGADVPFFVGENFAVEDGASPAQVVTVRNESTRVEPTINTVGGTVVFQSNSSHKGNNEVPTSIAKIETNPNNLTDITRQQMRAEAGSAQSNVIFNATAANAPTDTGQQFYFDEPAISTQNNLELILSGAQPKIGAGANGKWTFDTTGEVIDQVSQSQVDTPSAQRFDNVQALATRTFTMNNETYQPTNATPPPIQDPKSSGATGAPSAGIPLNAGYVTVGANSEVFQDGGRTSLAQCSALQPSVNEKDVTVELEEGRPHPINTLIQTEYQGKKTDDNRKNKLQVNHVTSFRREGAFDANGAAQNPAFTSNTSADITNQVYLFARGFDSKNPQNQNLQETAQDKDCFLSYVVEAGYQGAPISQSIVQTPGTPTVKTANTVSMVNPSNQTLNPGLWSVTGNLPGLANIDIVPGQPVSSVKITENDIDRQTGIVGVGDLYYNSISDSMVISFCGQSSSLSGNAKNVGGTSSGSDQDQSIIRFPYTGTPQKLTVPANTVNVHFIMVGAGGASESEGLGGAGSQIEGDLISNDEPGWWNAGQDSELSILVGGGGNRDPNQRLNSFGGGGAGQITGLGQGGGRSAIQSVDASGPITQYKDRIVAGGGGGSTGSGKGGDAGAYSHGDLESSQAGSGWPSQNGGQGANLTLASGSTFHDVPSGSSGRGGITQGLNQKSAGQKGGFSRGGSSQNQPPGTGALGSGGGGGGYFGGGAASYLGSSDNAYDVPAGGGGGSSYAPSHSVKNLISSAGSGSSGPSMSPLAMKLLANEGSVGAGGALGSPGNHGSVIIILTHRKGNAKGTANGNADVASIQQSKNGFDPRVQQPFQGKGITAAQMASLDSNAANNNPHRAVQCPFAGTKPQSPIVSVFINNHFIIGCEQGNLAEKNGFWFASLNASTPSLTNEFSSLLGNASNIRAIRSLDGQNQPQDKGFVKIALIGDGIWILQIKVEKKASQTAADFTFKGEAVSSVTDEPLTDIFSFQDGAQNPTEAGEFLVSGVPKTLSMSMSLHANLLPMFATAVPAPDLLTWGGLAQQAQQSGNNPNVPSLPYPGQPPRPGSANWIPSEPMDVIQRSVQHGVFQDNEVRFATNGTQTVAIGGYLGIDSSYQQGQGNLSIPSGTPQSFFAQQYKTSQGSQMISGMVDWTHGTQPPPAQPTQPPTLYSNNTAASSIAGININTGYASWIAQINTGPLIRTPSTILISEDAGSSFNLAFSEQANLQNTPSIEGGTLLINSKVVGGPNQVPATALSNQVALPLDQVHQVGNPGGAQVYNFFQSIANANVPTTPKLNQWTSNINTQGNITNFTNWYSLDTESSQNMVSRFKDVIFFPDPVSKQSTTQAYNTGDVVFFNGLRYVATTSIKAGIDPNLSKNWKNAENNVPGFFVAVGCFTQDMNMCHFLGGGLPLAGNVVGTFKNTTGSKKPDRSFGQSGTVPINWFYNVASNGEARGPVSGSQGLMNNCIWLLHTSDIDKARAGSAGTSGPGYSFKARPLSSSRAHENFLYCFSVHNLEHQDDSGKSPANASASDIILTTDIGIYRISHANLLKAQNEPLMVASEWTFSETYNVTYWNNNNYVIAEPIAENIQCRASKCDACTNTKSNPLNSVQFAGTAYMGNEIVTLCVTPYKNDQYTIPQSGAPSVLQSHTDTWHDSKNYFDLLNVLGGNAGSLTQQTVQNPNSGQDLGQILNGDGTTGYALAKQSQSLFAINLNFGTDQIQADDSQQPQLDLESIKNQRIVEVGSAGGNAQTINQVGKNGAPSGQYSIYVNGNTPENLINGTNNLGFTFESNSASQQNVQSPNASNTNALVVGPFITWVQSQQNNQTAVLQGPYSGPDGFNSAIGPKTDGNFILIQGLQTGGRQPTGTLDAQGNSYASQRYQAPIVNPTPGTNGYRSEDFPEAPFIWHPFLGLANSWDGQWDPYVNARASLKGNSPAAGIVQANTNDSTYLQVGYVDAGASDLNGLQQMNDLQTENSQLLPTAWFPNQNPLTQANAMLPSGGLDPNPITAPFQPSGTDQQLANQPNQGVPGQDFGSGQTNNTNLTLGIQQLFRLGEGLSNGTNAPTKFITTFEQAQIPSPTTTTQMNNAKLTWPNDPANSAAGTSPLEFSTLALDAANKMHSYQGFAALDLVNFYSVGQDPTQTLSPTNQPSLAQTLAQIPITSAANDITNFYAQQVPLLFAVQKNTNPAVVQYNTSSYQAMTIPMVTTNFFRPRNWFFQWPENANSSPSGFDVFMPANGGGSYQLNDQPNERLSSSTVPSQQQSEFMYPDPFTTWNGSSSIAANPTQARTPFMYTLGLTQVQMPLAGDTLTPILMQFGNQQGLDPTYKYILNPMVPFDETSVFSKQVSHNNLPPEVTSYSELLSTAQQQTTLANSTAPGVTDSSAPSGADTTVGKCQPFAFPDGSFQNANSLATFLAEDAAQVPNAQSPYQCNAQGIYFSGGRVLPQTVTVSQTSSEMNASYTKPNPTALQFEFQMDIFVNMSILQNLALQTEFPGFAFANVSDIGSQNWQSYIFAQAFLNGNNQFNPMKAFYSNWASSLPTSETLPNNGVFFCNVTNDPTNALLETAAGNVFPLIWLLLETQRVPSGGVPGQAAANYPGSQTPQQQNPGALVTGESLGFNLVQNNVPYFNQVLLSAQSLSALKAGNSQTPQVKLNAPTQLNGESIYQAGSNFSPLTSPPFKVEPPLVSAAVEQTYTFTNGFQNLSFSIPGGPTVEVPITTALQFFRMSYTITVPIASDSTFYAPSAADKALPPNPGSNVGVKQEASKSLSFPGPSKTAVSQEVSLVGYIGPPKGYSGSSDGKKTIGSQGVLIVNAGSSQQRAGLVQVLQNALNGSRLSIQQVAQFSSSCGPCTVAGTDPLFGAPLSIKAGSQVRTQSSILDFTVGPGLGQFKFNTSNLQKDWQLTKRVESMGPLVEDQVYIVVDLSQGDVIQPTPSAPNCKTGCVMTSKGQTQQFASQKKKTPNQKQKTPFKKGLGAGDGTPQFDSNQNMFQVDIPFSQSASSSPPLANATNSAIPLNLANAITTQQPTFFNNPNLVDMTGNLPLPFFKVLVDSGDGSLSIFNGIDVFNGAPADQGYSAFHPNITTASSAAQQQWTPVFQPSSTSGQAGSQQTGNTNDTYQLVLQFPWTKNSNGDYVPGWVSGATTQLNPDEVTLTANAAGVSVLYPGVQSLLTSTAPNVFTENLVFNWGWPDNNNAIGDMSGRVRFYQSQNESPADIPDPSPFEPNNLQQALWTPNLDTLSTSVQVQAGAPLTLTQSALNVDSFIIQGANNGTFQAQFNATQSELLPLPGSNLGVDVAELLASAASGLCAQPINSTPSDANSSSLMRNPLSQNNPQLNPSMIYQTALQANVQQQDVLPAQSASGGQDSSAFDVPVDFDPSKIYAAGQQIILDGTIQENRGKPNAVSWTLITGDNSNPSPNVIVVQNIPGQTVAIGSEIIGRGIPSGTTITTYRQDPSTPAKKYTQVLQITLSQPVKGIQPGQTVFTNDAQTLAKFDSYFAAKRPLNDANTARASQEFYNSALANSKTFQATLAYANPQVPFRVIPSSTGGGGMKSGLGTPRTVNPQSKNPLTNAEFPIQSQTNQQVNFSIQQMNTQHVNPYFNAWTFAQLFNGLKGTEMTSVEGNLSVLPFANQYTRGTGMIPISFIVAGQQQAGSTGALVGQPNLQDSGIIFAPNLSKWTFDMTPWTHDSDNSSQWNQMVLQGTNTFVHPNLVRFSIPYMLDTIDAPTTNSRKPGLEQQPLPNNFICVQAINSLSTTKMPFGLQRGASGLKNPQTAQKDLLPSHGTNNYDLQGSLVAAEDPNFLKTIPVRSLDPWGSRTNPILILTNPMKDIYHNGFNGGYNPIGQVQNDWPASLLQGDFHLGNGDPSTNQSNNGLIKGVNPAAVPPSSQRSQLGVASVQKHQDKVQMKLDFQGKRGLWLNFPNWATQVPAAQSNVFNQNPDVIKDQGTQALPICYQTSPLAQADPKYTLQGNQIKVFDNSNFGTSRGDWEGGQVLTNRNQNDFNPSVFGSQLDKDQTRPPLFGWLMTQFSSTNYGDQHQYANRSDVATAPYLPANATQQTPRSSFNFVPPGVPHNNKLQPGPIHSINASTGTYPEDLGIKGVANRNYLQTHEWPENVVTTSLTTDVPTQGTPQSPSFSRFQSQSYNYPTTDDPGWQYQMPTGNSQSFRFDGGAILNKDPATTPQSTSLGGPSCTTGVSIWLDAELGDTICIHQNLLRPMTTVARKSENGSPSLPGGLTMTSWPGVTDVGVGMIYDGGSSNPDGIQNFVPEFVPDVPLVNQPFAEINGGKPVEFQANRSGQGGYGTNDGDDPQAICCYFSDAPDFGLTPQEQAVENPYALAEGPKLGAGPVGTAPSNAVQSVSNTLTDVAPSAVVQSNQACVDVYQVFPPAPQSLSIFGADATSATVTSETDIFLQSLGFPQNPQNAIQSLLPLAFIPDTGNTITQLAPMTIPDFSGCGLSLMCQDQSFGNPTTLFQGSSGVLVPGSAENQSWNQTDPNEVLLQNANAPIFPKASPFYKQANLFQPVDGWTQDKVSGSSNPNTPFLFLNQVSDNTTFNLGPSYGLTDLYVGNPQAASPSAAATNWNSISNGGTPGGGGSGAIVYSGGLTAQPLRTFTVSLTSTGTSGLSQLAPTCVGTSPLLTQLNHCVIGASNGTLRLFNQKTNQTITSTSLSNFLIVTNKNSSQPVNVSQITQLVQFEKRWFAATNQGIFYTAVDPNLSVLAGNTEANIDYFNAKELIFVYFNVGPLATSNAALPPCTFLKKVRNKNRSQLVASFPDQAQGFFQKPSGSAFPQLANEFPQAMQLPLNSGNSVLQNGEQINSSFASVAANNIACQSFQIITKVSNKKNLNQFKVVSKFTGVPTVGNPSTNPTSGTTVGSWTTAFVPNPTKISNVQPKPVFMPQINSNVTDLLIQGDRVLQSSMQVPQKLSINPANPGTVTATNPNLYTYVQAMAQGSRQAMISFKNDILAPTPQKNAFSPGGSSGADTGTAFAPNGNPIFGSSGFSFDSQPPSLQGDSSMRIAQCLNASASQLNTLFPNSTVSVVSNFLKTFFTALEKQLTSAGYPQISTGGLDPHVQDCGQGILAYNGSSTGMPLENVLIAANPQEPGQGIQNGSLGVFLLSPSQVLAPQSLQPTYQSPSQVATLETNLFMQAFWGFNKNTLVVFGNSNGNPAQELFGVNQVGPDANLKFIDAQNKPNCFGFPFFGNETTAQQNSAIMQWSTKTSKPVFSPKQQTPDSALNVNAADLATDGNKPPLNERIFEILYLSRFNLIWANDTIGDFTQAPDLKGGILAWTVSGPQSILPIQMSGANSEDPGLAPNGTVRIVQDTDASIESIITQTKYKQPNFGLPAIGTGAILAQNPQTNEFWGAGIGLGVDDSNYMSTVTTQNPLLEVDTKFVPQQRKRQRFMIVKNFGAKGTPYSDTATYTYGGGVPSAATDLLPSAMNWVEEINILPTRSSVNSQKQPVTLLSQSFENAGAAVVTAIEFSQNATVIAGYTTSLTTEKTTTALWQLLSDGIPNNWAKGPLLVEGRITAVKFVNFGWYIAVASTLIVKDRPVPYSSLYFASANFSVIGLVDTWGPQQTDMEVTSFAYTIRPNTQPCDEAAGFEPNPINPRTCLKKCPAGYDPVGDLCALTCPVNLGFKTTLVPNECVPLKQKPKKAAGVGPLTGVANMLDNEAKPSAEFVEPPAPIDTLRGGLIGIAVAIFLIAFIFQIVYMFRFYKITKPNF